MKQTENMKAIAQTVTMIDTPMNGGTMKGHAISVDLTGD